MCSKHEHEYQDQALECKASVSRALEHYTSDQRSNLILQSESLCTITPDTKFDQNQAIISQKSIYSALGGHLGFPIVT